MKPFLFLISLCYPVSTLLGYYYADDIGAAAYFLAPIVLFVIFPIVELCCGKAKTGAPSSSPARSLGGTPWFVVCLLAATHFFMIAWGALHVTSLAPLAYLGLTISVGITTGAIGITTAHELLHKPQAVHKALGLTMMLGVCYMFFYPEHVKGHHKNVGLPHDPTSGRLGENYYRYLWRSTCDIVRFIVALERKDAARKPQSFWHWRNPSFWYLVLPFVLMLGLAASLGAAVLPYFLGQSLVAYLLLEMVSYIEHYGLARRQLADGRYEKVTDDHTWDANFVWSNYAILNLQHHAHHHAAPALPYHLLQPRDGKKQLPFGYPTMALFAAIPPLWSWLMDRRCER